MAFIRNEYCYTCGIERIFIDGRCNVCEVEKEKKKEEEWNSKEIGEKLIDLHRRLTSLEQKRII